MEIYGKLKTGQCYVALIDGTAMSITVCDGLASLVSLNSETARSYFDSGNYYPCSREEVFNCLQSALVRIQTFKNQISKDADQIKGED